MYDQFHSAVNHILTHTTFNVDQNVSVFETNIRAVGALVSAHVLLVDERTPVFRQEYRDKWERKKNQKSNQWKMGIFSNDFDSGGRSTQSDWSLMDLAVDLAQRLLPAFQTSRGIPYGTVNLRSGVPAGETPVVGMLVFLNRVNLATAAAGTFILEFAMISRLTGDPRFEIAAHKALIALFASKSPIGLFGQHIDALSGQWYGTVAGVGNYIDSFYEYLLKGYLLLDRDQYLLLFEEVYESTKKHLNVISVPVLAELNTGNKFPPVVDSLQVCVLFLSPSI